MESRGDLLVALGVLFFVLSKLGNLPRLPFDSCTRFPNSLSLEDSHQPKRKRAEDFPSLRNSLLQPTTPSQGMQRQRITMHPRAWLPSFSNSTFYQRLIRKKL
jgi:hypothetical protein